MKVLFLGPAASGKTTLVWKFGDYLKEQEIDVCRVNLDCAVKTLPYKADFDVRKFFTLENIMKEYNLGPNGALMKSIELIFELRKNILNFLKDFEISLIDFPGQLELAIFHPLKLSELFKERGVAVFLLPADLLQNYKDYVFLRLINLAVDYRLDMPCVHVISKAELLEECMLRKKKVEDDFTEQLLEIIEKSKSAQRTVYVSSLKERGFDELYSLIHEAFCTCGDME